jgi:hypothetical protein
MIASGNRKISRIFFCHTFGVDECDFFRTVRLQTFGARLQSTA